MKNYLLSPGIEPTISISRDSHIYHSSTLPQVVVGISCIYVWTSTALKDWLYFPTIKIGPVVHEKQLSGSQIRISIRITPNFELGLSMIITSLLTKFHQNPTSSLWEILLTNKHTKVIAISRFSRDNQKKLVAVSEYSSLLWTKTIAFIIKDPENENESLLPEVAKTHLFKVEYTTSNLWQTFQFELSWNNYGFPIDIPLLLSNTWMAGLTTLES